jgi:hypothetical protein
LQRSAIQKTELNNIADIIAFNVNEASKKTDEFQTKITFVEGSKEFVQIPGLYKGNKYEVRIQPDQVVLSQDGDTVASTFVSVIHCYNWSILKPYDYYTNDTIIWQKDQVNNERVFESGHDFIIYQKKMNINGSAAFKTFIWPEKEEST